MRQLMGINGETVLARSAPKENQERTRLKLGAHPVKTRSAPKKNQERTQLKLAFQPVDSKSFLAWRAIRPRRWRREPQRRRRTLLLQRKSRSKVPQVASPLWCRGTFSFCSRHTFQGGVMVCFLSIFCASSAGTSSPGKKMPFSPMETAFFAYLRPNLHAHHSHPYTARQTALHRRLRNPTQPAAQSYTMQGFVQDSCTKPYTPNYTDFQMLSTFCVGFAKNVDRP